MNARTDDAPATEQPVDTPAEERPVEAPAAERAARVWRPPRKRIGAIALIVFLAAGALFAVLTAWNLPPFAGGLERTDNAYVRGLTMNVAPQVTGYVVAVEVRDYEQVHAGQVLARIDDRIYKARVAAARANLSAQLAGLANARAQLLRARADMARVNDLVRDGSVSIRERDQTLAALRQAEAQARQANGGQGSFEAQVDAARAQLDLAQIDLEHTVITAAADGQVSEIGVRVGQYVTLGTQLMSLVPAERWVIANFKEAQIARMAPGQTGELHGRCAERCAIHRSRRAACARSGLGVRGAEARQRHGKFRESAAAHRRAHRNRSRPAARCAAQPRNVR